MKVLGIGEVVLDKVNLLHEYPKEGTKIRPSRVTFSLGGPVPAALIVLKRLGAKCTFLGSIGLDINGSKLKRKLKRENINLIPIKTKRTKLNTILINEQNGSRTIVKSNTKSELISNIDRRIIQAADLILLDRHEPSAFEEVVLKKREGTRLIVDPSTEVSQKTLKMLKLVDYPILPIESLKKIRRFEDCQTNLERLYRKVKKTIVITAGNAGSIIYDGSYIKLIPAYKVRVVDTLGAGDVYRGAFGYGIMNRWGIRKSARFANAVSALQCTRIGNVSAIPGKKEIFEFFNMQTNNYINLKNINGYVG